MRAPPNPPTPPGRRERCPPKKSCSLLAVAAPGSKRAPAHHRHTGRRRAAKLHRTQRIAFPAKCSRVAYRVSRVGNRLVHGGKPVGQGLYGLVTCHFHLVERLLVLGVDLFFEFVKLGLESCELRCQCLGNHGCMCIAPQSKQKDPTGKLA